MPDRSSPLPRILVPPVRVGPLPLGERRDAKQESSFHGAGSTAQRSLAKELLADRKR